MAVAWVFGVEDDGQHVDQLAHRAVSLSCIVQNQTKSRRNKMTNKLVKKEKRVGGRRGGGGREADGRLDKQVAASRF